MRRLVLIDSSVYIEVIRAGLDPVAEIGRRYSLDDVVSCGVVKAEVLRGIKGPRRLEAMQCFFAVTQTVATSGSLWDEVWQLAWQLDRESRVLPLQDVVIACCARRVGAAVMTRDAHFREVPGLEVIEP
ncbi:PIN domain-containing protein [Haloferula sp. A504]|uniref:PIN domain-containing protein n=1 Tax=Haloferula sp. A504 TaxID=3373601 RepID=UPI0031BF9CA3|nr:PIN domain-containing protein [Verrucomicrobiaceae bacterium E54]